MKVKPGKTDVASLAAWLDRHQAALNLVSDHQYPAATQEWDGSTILAFPTHLVSSVVASHEPPAAASTLTALTSLSFRCQDGDLECNLVNLLRPLSRLQQLSMSWRDLSSTAEEVFLLPALKQLQALELKGCRLQATPRALTALAQLTSLDLSGSVGTAPLPHLQHLCPF